MAETLKKVIIVGKAGNGKSSLGNTLLGKEEFPEGSGFSAQILTCQREFNRQFEIVVTPGLFDITRNRNVARQAESILNALKLCPEPHAFLIVMKYNKFTTEEVLALDVLQITFGDQYFHHSSVVVTHVDNFITEDEFKNACRESYCVTELLKRCGRRVIRINNKQPKKEHVATLSQYIDQVSQSGKSYYKNDFLRCSEEVSRRYADLDKYDSMLVHEQVETIAKEIKKRIFEETERVKKLMEEKERRKEREEQKYRIRFFFHWKQIQCIGKKLQSML